LYCDDADVIVASFYLMEKVEGLVLRNRPPEGLDLGPDVMQRLSCAAMERAQANNKKNNVCQFALKDTLVLKDTFFS
jgi:hypothetical protein